MNSLFNTPKPQVAGSNPAAPTKKLNKMNRLKKFRLGAFSFLFLDGGHGGGVNFVIDSKCWFCARVFKGEFQSHRSVRDISSFTQKWFLGRMAL